MFLLLLQWWDKQFQPSSLVAQESADLVFRPKFKQADNITKRSTFGIKSGICIADAYIFIQHASVILHLRFRHVKCSFSLLVSFFVVSATNFSSIYIREICVYVSLGREELLPGIPATSPAHVASLPSHSSCLVGVFSNYLPAVLVIKQRWETIFCCAHTHTCWHTSCTFPGGRFVCKVGRIRMKHGRFVIPENVTLVKFRVGGSFCNWMKFVRQTRFIVGRVSLSNCSDIQETAGEIFCCARTENTTTKDWLKVWSCGRRVV